MTALTESSVGRGCGASDVCGRNAGSGKHAFVHYREFRLPRSWLWKHATLLRWQLLEGSPPQLPWALNVREAIVKEIDAVTLLGYLATYETKRLGLA